VLYELEQQGHFNERIKVGVIVIISLAPLQTDLNVL